MKARDGSVTTDTVPTLAKVLDLAAPPKAEVLPEIKTAGGGRRYAGIEEKVLALLRARRFGERATIQAFDEATIRRLHELDPTQRTMLLVSPRRLETARAEPPEAVRWTSEVGASDVGMDYRTIDARVIAAAARPARVRLSAWTVNAEADLGRLLDLGVEVVMSDHPDLALSLASHLPRKP
jgi:glycerophosphoryl diester phosphodiesterase